MPSINTPPLQDDVTKNNVSWSNWFTQVFHICFDVQSSGTTAKRPISNMYVGKPYYDTTLGYAINVHSVGPPAVWHNGAGGVV